MSVWLDQGKQRRADVGDIPKAIDAIAQNCLVEARAYNRGAEKYRHGYGKVEATMFPYDAAIRILHEAFAQARELGEEDAKDDEARERAQKRLDSFMKESEKQPVVCPGLQEVREDVKGMASTQLHIALSSLLDEKFEGWDQEAPYRMLYDRVGLMREGKDENAQNTGRMRDNSFGPVLSKTFLAFATRGPEAILVRGSEARGSKEYCIRQEESHRAGAGIALVLQLTCYLFALGRGRAGGTWGEEYLEWIAELHGITIAARKDTPGFERADEVRAENEGLVDLVASKTQLKRQEVAKIVCFEETVTSRSKVNSPLMFREPLSIAAKVMALPKECRVALREEALCHLRKENLPNLAEKLERVADDLQLFCYYLCMKTGRFEVTANDGYMRTVFSDLGIHPETGEFYGRVDKVECNPLAILYVVRDQSGVVCPQGFYVGTGQTPRIGLRWLARGESAGILQTHEDDARVTPDYLYVTGDGSCHYQPSSGTSCEGVTPPIRIPSENGGSVEASIYSFDRGYTLPGAAGARLSLILGSGVTWSFRTMLPGESDAGMARVPRDPTPCPAMEGAIAEDGEGLEVYVGQDALVIVDRFARVSRADLEVSLGGGDDANGIRIRRTGGHDSSTLFLLEPAQMPLATPEGVPPMLKDAWRFSCSDSCGDEDNDANPLSLGFLSWFPGARVVGSEWLSVNAGEGFGILAFNASQEREFPAHAQVFLFAPDPAVEKYVELFEELQLLKADKRAKELDAKASKDGLDRLTGDKRHVTRDGKKIVNPERKELEKKKHDAEHEAGQLGKECETVEASRIDLEVMLREAYEGPIANNIISDINGGRKLKVLTASWYACADVY